jgi:hypothetical protein
MISELGSDVTTPHSAVGERGPDSRSGAESAEPFRFVSLPFTMPASSRTGRPHIFP